jgi:hypothetical protein
MGTDLPERRAQARHLVRSLPQGFVFRLQPALLSMLEHEGPRYAADDENCGDNGFDLSRSHDFSNHTDLRSHGL